MSKGRKIIVIVTFILLAIITVCMIVSNNKKQSDSKKEDNKVEENINQNQNNGKKEEQTTPEDKKEDLNIEELKSKAKEKNTLKSKELLEQTKSLVSSSYRIDVKATTEEDDDFNEELVLKKDNTFWGYYELGSSGAYEGYYIIDNNKLTLYIHKLYGSDAECIILNNPEIIELTIDNDKITGSIIRDFKKVTFNKTTFDNEKGIINYINNIEETVYENMDKLSD